MTSALLLRSGTTVRPVIIPAVRQIAFLDPAPSNEGPEFVGTAIDGNNHGHFAVFGSDTLPGSSIVMFGTCAYDSTHSLSNACDPINGVYTILDTILNTFDQSNCNTRTWIMPNAAVIKSTSWSGTGHLTGATPNIFVIDSITSGALSLGDLLNGASVPTSCFIQSLSSGSANTVGAQYVMSSTYTDGVTVGTESMTASNPVLMKVNIASGDYNGFVAFEVTGVTASPVVGHTAQALSQVSGTDAATSGTAACGSSPIILLGFAFNGNVGSSPFDPAAGTGFTHSASCLVFDIGPLARYEYQNFANPGSIAATFTPSGKDDFSVHMLALLGAS